MKRFYYTITIAAASLMALASCVQGFEPDTANDNSVDLDCPDMMASFSEGDALGLYMTYSSQAGSQNLAGERYCDNVRFVKVSDKFVSNPKLFFPEDESVYNDIYVYAPYVEAFLAEGEASTQMQLPSDQKAEVPADLRYASVLDFRPNQGKLSFSMKHAFAKVNIVLAPGGYYENVDEIPESITVSVKDVQLSADINLENMTAQAAGQKSELVPSGEFKKDGGKLRGMSFIIPEQEIPAGELFIEIIAGDDRFLVKPAQPIAFAQGTESTLNITLNADFAGVIVNMDVKAEPWVDSDPIDMEQDEVLPPSGDTVTDYDGNEYKIVRIGRQYWMGSNLRTTHLNDGTPLFKNEVKSEWKNHLNEASYTAYENDYSESSLQKMGLLYNRFAVESDGLCPEGWHVPSTTDWDILGAALGGTLDDAHSWLGIGYAMMSTEGWADGLNGTNESGFNAYPAGFFYCVQDEQGTDKSNYWSKGEGAKFWSYTAFFGNAFVRSLDISYPNDLFRVLGMMESGYSVRCVHDF